MRSIRLSLTVYFLALLAAAVGVASLLVYRWGQGTLRGEERETQERLQAEYNTRCDAERARLDQALLHQAQTLARLVDFHTWSPDVHYHRSLGVAGYLGSAPGLGGPVPAAIWAVQAARWNPIWFEVARKVLAQIKLDEDELLKAVDRQSGDGQAAEYFQINTTWGSSYYSESLGSRSLPLNPETFARGQVLHWEFEDLELSPEIRVHRVTLKAPLSRIVPFGRVARPRGGRRPANGAAEDRPPPPPRGRPESWPSPPIFIQCAYDVRKRDAALQGFQEDRDNQLASLRAETAASLGNLRNNLVLISTLTFAATVLGCFWLVRLGLTPLHRLSEAVSRVSPRDFRLPFDEPRLPAELRPIVQRLTDTLALLQRAFAREKQATADISHELRTPLAALLTTTELALRKPRSPEQYRELLQDCQLSAQQMNQVIDRLLTLARLDAGVDALRPQSVDVAQVAEQCAAVVRPLAEARGLSLNVHKKSPAPLATDPDKLREVLTNLLHNAIQYNRPDGSIDLTVSRVNGHLNVEVSDTGIGIAAEARGLIFERFYRADPSRGTDGLHAGLGLAIVKEYVDLMGGTISVDSTEGRGSTFLLRLPVHPPKEEG